MARTLTINTGSRLHFGPLAWKPDHGRDFGGWGVMLETPRTVVRVAETESIPQPLRTRSPLQQKADVILERLTRDTQPADARTFSVDVLEEPPPHCGFGSGTQLALAIGAAVSRLRFDSRPLAAELALLTGRGLRSAVGIYGFDRGGLIVDAGKLPGDAVGELAVHVPVPDEWRFVLVRPDSAIGLAGDREAAAFRDLPPFGEALTARLRRLVFDEVVPAVRENRLDAFAAALDEYGILVGEAFRPCQGDVVHPAAMPIWTAVREHGVRGIAQTSWGPTLAIVCGAPEAADLTASVVREISPRAIVQISRARNRAAEIVTE